MSACLNLPESATAGLVKQRLAALTTSVDAVQVDEDRAATGAMDPLAVAGIAIAEGVDPALQLSCRDRNRLALRGTLLGAHALGVSTVVLTRGEKLPDSMRGKVKGVFDTTAIQLINLARSVTWNQDERIPVFHIGAFAPVIRPKQDWQAAQLSKKIESGINFLQLRPCLNLQVLQDYMARLVALKIPQKVSIIVDVPLVTSAEAIRELQEWYTSTRVPQDITNRIVGAVDPEAEGVAACAEMISALRQLPGVSGANIVGSPDPALTVAAIERSRAAGD